MTIETIITIAALLSGSLGWLAFAKEYRAGRALADSLMDEQAEHHALKVQYRHMADAYRRLTDRDERGRFVKREGKA